MKIQARDGTENFRIGNFTVKPTRNLFVSGGTSYSLEPRIMDVLCKLAAHPRQVISRDELIESVWAVEFGADESLTRAISVLRRTFKNAGETEQLIQTIPKRGYRLAVDVTQEKFDAHIAREPHTNLSASDHIENNPLQPVEEQTLEQNQRQPLVKMTAADISGFTPHEKITNSAKPRSVRKHLWSIILGALILLLIIITIFGMDRYRGSQKIGQSLSIPQYGRSIAVLPLVDLSAESNITYFTDGMAEELLGALTQISDLRVAGATSSFAYKNKNMSIGDIGKKLKVSHIIDGSVRKHAERIKVTIRLNNTSNGAQVWSKSYNGTLDNAIALQEEISQDIMLNLELILGISYRPLPEINVQEQ